MKAVKVVVIMMLLCAVGFAVSVVPASSEHNRPSFDSEKNRLMHDIEDLVQGLRNTKSCVSQAGSVEELKKCRDTEKVRRFQRLQEELSEMGLSREERKVRKSPREY